jgi:hypothetical protein
MRNVWELIALVAVLTFGGVVLGILTAVGMALVEWTDNEEDRPCE